MEDSSSLPPSDKGCITPLSGVHCPGGRSTTTTEQFFSKGGHYCMLLLIGLFTAEIMHVHMLDNAGP